MINVLFKTESHFPVKKAVVTKAITSHLKHHIKRKAEVSVAIVGNRKMRSLNRTYRNIDKTCTVLAFPLHESSSNEEPFIHIPDNVLRLGDIVVSFPEAVAKATKENTLVDDVIIELVLHGLDNLLMSS